MKFKSGSYPTADKTGKRKFPGSYTFGIAAIFTFGMSAVGVFPANWVETAYSDTAFPVISRITGWVADIVPFSWLDLAILAAVGVLIVSIRKKNGRFVIAAASVAYLWSFWTWGLNYHRMPLEAKLDVEAARVSEDDVEAFAVKAASELNRLWAPASAATGDWTATSNLASERVRRVVSVIEKRDWRASVQTKRSFLADGWFRVAGVAGVFNPLGHEPIAASNLMPFEWPFVMAHELAHVRGVPVEGDANLIALLATLSADDPAFQYSGWLHLWLYIRNSERDMLLEAGPRRDLQAYYERIRAQQIPWVSRLQGALLDWFLKANAVEEGVRSYARFVSLAIVTQDRWRQFR